MIMAESRGLPRNVITRLLPWDNMDVKTLEAWRCLDEEVGPRDIQDEGTSAIRSLLSLGNNNVGLQGLNHLSYEAIWGSKNKNFLPHKPGLLQL